MARVTMVDVATEAGVSVTSVSNAFNRPDQLSAAVRSQILDVAERLGYAGPDATARRLRTGRSDVVGVVFTERLSFAFAEPSATAFLEGLSREVEQHGLALQLLPAGAPDAISRAGVDGVVLYSLAADAPEVTAAVRRDGPVVVVDSPAPPDVTVDDHAGARTVVEHLVELGHRDVAVLCFRVLPDGWSGWCDVERRRASPFSVTAERLAGLEQALHDARAEGVDVTDPAAMDVWEVGAHHDRAAAREGVDALLALDPRPTALVCAADFLAIEALDRCRERGVRVPEDVSITGFDDVPLSARTRPGLTTVAQPSLEKGREAGRRLVAALHGDTVPAPVVLPVELVRRSSTGPAPT